MLRITKYLMKMDSSYIYLECVIENDSINLKKVSVHQNKYMLENINNDKFFDNNFMLKT